VASQLVSCCGHFLDQTGEFLGYPPQKKERALYVVPSEGLQYQARIALDPRRHRIPLVPRHHRGHGLSMKIVLYVNGDRVNHGVDAAYYRLLLASSTGAKEQKIDVQFR
jgi:hypothetical protein